MDRQTNKLCLWWVDPSWQVSLHPATRYFPQCSGGDNQKGKSEEKNLVGQDSLISEGEKQKRKKPKWYKSNHLPQADRCPVSHHQKAILEELSHFANHDLMWSGTPLWSSGVSLFTCSLVHPQPAHWDGSQKQTWPWHCVNTVEQ